MCGIQTEGKKIKYFLFFISAPRQEELLISPEIWCDIGN